MFRGEFTRSPRVSLLCFLDQDGLVDSFMTQGTFDRGTFLQCCRTFALSGQVQQYPGKRSVWILDGARIHCHPNFTYYLRSIGILPVFLPAYCPYYNPIEFFFGILKKYLRRYYKETGTKPKDLPVVVATALDQYKHYSMKDIFKNCGYSPSGDFDPSAYSCTSKKGLGFQ